MADRNKDLSSKLIQRQVPQIRTLRYKRQSIVQNSWHPQHSVSQTLVKVMEPARKVQSITWYHEEKQIITNKCLHHQRRAPNNAQKRHHHAGKETVIQGGTNVKTKR